VRLLFRCLKNLQKEFCATQMICALTQSNPIPANVIQLNLTHDRALTVHNLYTLCTLYTLHYLTALSGLSTLYSLPSLISISHWTISPQSLTALCPLHYLTTLCTHHTLSLHYLTAHCTDCTTSVHSLYYITALSLFSLYDLTALYALSYCTHCTATSALPANFHC
jgi:hypothetical protein